MRCRSGALQVRWHVMKIPKTFGVRGGVCSGRWWSENVGFLIDGFFTDLCVQFFERIWDLWWGALEWIFFFWKDKKGWNFFWCGSYVRKLAMHQWTWVLEWLWYHEDNINLITIRKYKIKWMRWREWRLGFEVVRLCESTSIGCSQYTTSLLYSLCVYNICVRSYYKTTVNNNKHIYVMWDTIEFIL